jgi:AcrR family transcriptional regulator
LQRNNSAPNKVKTTVKKRVRRTKKELEDALWITLEKQIIEKGFDNITVAGLAQEAGFEPLVIYNRFKNIDELLEKYVRKYDYWLNDIFKLKKENTAKDNLKELLVGLINNLYGNEIMQRVLTWELNDTHKITRRMVLSRELDYSEVIQYFDSRLDNYGGIGSLMTAGIYYLILHCKISTFNHINFNTPQGKELMIETVTNMIDKLFPPENISSTDNKTIDIAKKLLKKGVDKEIIKEATGLSIKEIDTLIVK